MSPTRRLRGFKRAGEVGDGFGGGFELADQKLEGAGEDVGGAKMLGGVVLNTTAVSLRSMTYQRRRANLDELKREIQGTEVAASRKETVERENESDGQNEELTENSP